MSQMEKEGFGEEFSICSAVFFWRISGGLFGGLIFQIFPIAPVIPFAFAPVIFFFLIYLPFTIFFYRNTAEKFLTFLVLLLDVFLQLFSFCFCVCHSVSISGIFCLKNSNPSIGELHKVVRVKSMDNACGVFVFNTKIIFLIFAILPPPNYFFGVLVQKLFKLPFGV